MAEIRKVVRREALSDFRRVAPEGGGAFRALAQLANTAYEYIKPAAIQEMTEEGAALGREIARQQIGNPVGTMPMGATPKAGGSGGSSSGGEDYVRQGLIARGMPAHVAEAFVWNGNDESGLMPDINEAAPIVPGSRGGFGIMQWTGPRRRALEAFASERGVPVGDIDMQMDFLMFELEGSEKSAAESIFAAKDTGTAAAAIVNNFLRPAEEHRSRREARYLSGSGGSSSGGEASAFVPTILREADGKLTSRLFSPMGGEILQAHNAAAGVAYQSEQLLQADIDMMGLSEQFALDPEGFQQAARAYLDDRIEKAPALFKEDLRNSLEREVQRRFLGILEDRQADTRRRADNSSSALAERWASNLSAAIASGNEDEIATARSELESILIARESLPGVAWTRAQSENAIIDAERRGQEEIEKQRKAASTEQKSQARTVIEAAKAGMHSPHEAILSDPAFIAENPELAAEGRAQVALRDSLPSFFASPKAERDKAVAELKSVPVSEGFEVDIAKAAETANSSITKAWEDDPIATASQYLPQKPPALPGAGDPNFTEALAARREYGLMLRDQGYTDRAFFLSDTEAENIGKMMSKDAPPEVRAALAGAIVEGFGPDAMQVFTEIKSDDPTTRFAGMLMASGRDAATSAIATEAMRGQALIDERMVQLPTKTKTVAAIDPMIATAMSYLPNSTKTEADLAGFATAIYAARAGNLDPSSEAATDLMKQSLQAALGQSTDKRGNITGGVQEVGGNPVLLPVGVSGEKLEARMAEALGSFSGGWDAFGAIWGDTRKPVPEIWAAAGVHSKNPPMLGGEPLSHAQWSSGNIKLIPVSKNIYRLEQHTSGGGVTDLRDENGNVYMMDVSKFLEGGQ